MQNKVYEIKNIYPSLRFDLNKRFKERNPKEFARLMQQYPDIAQRDDVGIFISIDEAGEQGYRVLQRGYDRPVNAIGGHNAQDGPYLLRDVNVESIKEPLTAFVDGNSVISGMIHEDEHDKNQNKENLSIMNLAPHLGAKIVNITQLENTVLGYSLEWNILDEVFAYTAEKLIVGSPEHLDDLYAWLNPEGKDIGYFMFSILDTDEKKAKFKEMIAMIEYSVAKGFSTNEIVLGIKGELMNAFNQDKKKDVINFASIDNISEALKTYFLTINKANPADIEDYQKSIDEFHSHTKKVYDETKEDIIEEVIRLRNLYFKEKAYLVADPHLSVSNAAIREPMMMKTFAIPIENDDEHWYEIEYDRLTDQGTVYLASLDESGLIKLNQIIDTNALTEFKRLIV
jgi:hypothetical protein